jgi:phage baseplate assembly protein W
VGNFNFKSVGKTSEQTLNDNNSLVVTPTIFGIKTPLRSTGEFIFDVTYSLNEQIGDNLRNLILTNFGERLGLYNYGGNLRPLLFEFTTLDNFDSQAITRISSAVQLWMPYIVLNNFVSSVDKMQSSKNVDAIRLYITYDVPTLDLKDQAIEVILYVP